MVLVFYQWEHFLPMTTFPKDGNFCYLFTDNDPSNLFLKSTGEVAHKQVHQGAKTQYLSSSTAVYFCKARANPGQFSAQRESLPSTTGSELPRTYRSQKPFLTVTSGWKVQTPAYLLQGVCVPVTPLVDLLTGEIMLTILHVTLQF